MPSLPFLAQRFALGARLVLRFCRGDLSSVHTRPSVSRAALPSVHVWHYSSGATVCPQRAVGVTFLTRFALGARSAFRFWRSALPSAHTQPSVSRAALPSAHPVRAILPRLYPQRASGLPFLARLCPRFMPSLPFLARLCSRFTPSLPFLARLCPRRTSGLPFLSRLCRRFMLGNCVSAAAICLRFAPSFTVLLSRFASVHAQPLRF